MNTSEVYVGLPVTVLVGPGDRWRRGVVTGGPRDTRYGPGNSTWLVEFPSGATSLLVAREMEPADAVTRLGALDSEGDDGG